MRLIDGDALIEKAKYEAEGMEEPYSTDLTVIIDWLVGKMPTEHPEQEEFKWCRDCAEYDQMAHCCHRWTKVIRQTVEELKQEYRGEWIPLNKRLPEQDDRVLVYTAAHEFHVWGAMPNRADDYFWEDEDGLYHNKYLVEKWMPLPEESFIQWGVRK